MTLVQEHYQSKLLPCPFCGGRAEFRPALAAYLATNTNRIQCTVCGAGTDPNRDQNNAEAHVNVWNNRHEASNHDDFWKQVERQHGSDTDFAL